MKKQTSAATETRGEGRISMDYKGRQVYVGIDIHKKDWQVGIYYDGLVLGNHRMPGSSKKLISFLKAIRWLHGISQRDPFLFAHWKIGSKPTVG